MNTTAAKVEKKHLKTVSYTPIFGTSYVARCGGGTGSKTALVASLEEVTCVRCQQLGSREAK
jgi:hypothetical protein